MNEKWTDTHCYLFVAKNSCRRRAEYECLYWTVTHIPYVSLELSQVKWSGKQKS